MRRENLARRMEYGNCRVMNRRSSVRRFIGWEHCLLNPYPPSSLFRRNHQTGSREQRCEVDSILADRYREDECSPTRSFSGTGYPLELAGGAPVCRGTVHADAELESACGDLNYLHRLGFVLKRPKKRLVKADPVRRKAFVAEYATLTASALRVNIRRINSASSS